ncbi:uncharacterized protein MEPE_01328 [Melanopsichium pennsylvanicum]|uniref:F-box domain-containing protein n=2 Tax=Melanopsichium pennsylvanicum TaxID=63383 RepID=A0AAJ5C3I3_9BASI|nr:putative protein [Melanopsichium pennsylvanicum 4]SNX82622.1 uncharacterized protein MEPE_01328 [Melanopsichium pennsylvanicum]
MSNLARLLRWAPCLWAVSKLANNSGPAQRSQILNVQSGSQHTSSTSDVLHTLSFTTRSVVRYSQNFRATSAARSPRSMADTSPRDGNVGGLWRLRSRNPEVHHGWQWDHPPLLPVRWAQRAVSFSSKILRQVHGLSFVTSFPMELTEVVLHTVRHPVETRAGLGEVDLRLVCKQWNGLLRRSYWRKRWLNIRPEIARWRFIGERINTLAKNADVIKKVKFDGILSDIPPISLESALQECPELAEVALCRVKQIKVGKLDSVNEVLLKQFLLYHQNEIRHFAFRLEDTVLFLGRRSLFAYSILILPRVRRITVDISNSEVALYLEDLSNNSARAVSRFVAELIGRDDTYEDRTVEVRLFCMPSAGTAALPQISEDYVSLASQIFQHTRILVENMPGIRLATSFQGPLSSQTARDLRALRAWASGEGISLIDAGPQLLENSNGRTR